MSPITLQIKWRHSVELVILEELSAKGQVIRTSERWCKIDKTPIVSYVVNVDEFSTDESGINIRLRYSRSNQADKNIMDLKNGVGWGVTSIKLDVSGRSASAFWTDESGNERLSGPAKIEVIGGRSPVSVLRDTASVIKKLRPKQKELRDSLLLSDRSCFITKEAELAALEAAHIIPVSAGGVEIVENAILLRADLHRLFDAGLFWFDLKNDSAIAVHSKMLSGRYRKVISGKKLPNLIFQRVATALYGRSKLIDNTDF